MRVNSVQELEVGARYEFFYTADTPTRDTPNRRIGTFEGLTYRDGAPSHGKIRNDPGTGGRERSRFDVARFDYAVEA